MASAFTDFLTAGAGFGSGYLDEKKRRENMAMEQRKLVMQEKAADAETALRQLQYESDKAYKDAQIKHIGTEDTALYGDNPVPGGLVKYRSDAPGYRQDDSQDFLLDHPDFETPTSRMTPRDKTPYNPYTKYSPLGGGANGGAGASSPMDIANFRLNYLKGLMTRPQGVIPPPFAVQAQQADSMAGALGLDKLLKGDLTFPDQTKGNVRPNVNSKETQGPPVMSSSNALQKAMIDHVNSATDDPGTLMKELEADVQAAPEKFKGVDLNAVRAAIAAKRKR